MSYCTQNSDDVIFLTLLGWDIAARKKSLADFFSSFLAEGCKWLSKTCPTLPIGLKRKKHENLPTLIYTYISLNNLLASSTYKTFWSNHVTIYSGKYFLLLQKRFFGRSFWWEHKKFLFSSIYFFNTIILQLPDRYRYIDSLVFCMNFFNKHRWFFFFLHLSSFLQLLF